MEKKASLALQSSLPPARMRLFLRLLLPAALLAAWAVVAHLKLFSPYLLPPPRAVIEALADLLQTGTLWEHLAASLTRVLTGFSLAVALALPLGVVVGLSPLAQELFSPTLAFLQHVPPIAWIPLFILWLGIGEASKNAVIAYAAFFPVFLNTLHGLSATDRRLVEVGLLYRLTRWQLVKEIYLKAAAPAIFTGLRLGLGYSWRALVAAELIAASSGLGYLIVEARELSQPPVVLAGVLIIGLVGLALEGLLALAQRRLFRRRAAARSLGAMPARAVGGAACRTWR